MRSVAIVALLTLNFGAPVVISKHENNLIAENIFNGETINFFNIRPAEALNNFDVVSYSNIKLETEDATFFGRLGVIGKVVIGIIGLILLVTCWPILIAIAIGWAVINWLFFGSEKK